MQKNTTPTKGHVYFVGAGPGDPELMTLKGKRCIEEASLVLYAGSLVPKAILNFANTNAKIIDSAPLNLTECHKLLQEAALNGEICARVHTGDPSLYGTIREQIRLLKADNISYSVIPGITAACAAAALAGISFTVPEVTQSLVFTRMPGRTPMPEKEHIAHFARTGASMAVYLSATHAEELQKELCKELPQNTPVLCAHAIGWPEQKLVWTQAGQLAKTVLEHGFARQTLFLVLPGEEASATESLLYAKHFSHGFRQGK